MKVLIVHMRYYPDATGTAPLVTQLAQDLARDGAEVVVITSLPHYGRDSVHPDYREHPGFFHRSQESGVEVIRTPVFVPRHRGTFQRALNYISYNLNTLPAGLLVRKVDVVLAVNPPITTTFSAWILSVLHRSPLILSIQDIWPDCLIQVGQIKNRILISASKLLEKIQYSLAKKIVVLSRGMKDNLVLKGIQEDKIKVITNWADTDEVIPLPRENPFSQGQGLEDYFVILFAGNHGYIGALECIIEAADLLKDHPEILFLLAGEGSVKGDLISLVKRKGINNVRFLPTQPKGKWLEMLAAADLGLVTLRKDLADLNVPSKVYTLMAAGRPILSSVPETSEVVRLVQDANCGFTSAPENPAELAREILEIKRDKTLLEKLGQNGREYLLKYLSRTRQTALYYDLLEISTGKE
jgi:colanic acid biosynthesis glycosyl transferase WcaI